MAVRNHKHLAVFIAFAVVTVGFYLWFIGTEHFVQFKNWSQENLVIYISVLFTLKIVGIIWPPIPGGVLTMASVPILGWPTAYIVDFTGSAVGSSAAYFIGKKYGLNFLSKIFDESTIDRLKRNKIKHNREIESIFLFRVFGGTIVEVICYGAGILGVSYRNFLIATILSHPPFGIPTFYLANNLLQGRGFVVGLAFVLIAVLLYKKSKRRYFERRLLI